ncbi:putative glucan binding protein [Fimicolochytrium jonesii]|uniref:putative glucan binding protein n=1 Tax=Fimicolochytrium jonesii TaxID=1396493 RepID=UPI0022FE0F28|nr:putative glucan binding protein [Fimicolochytrium jonesii]KAI8819675.1 putative glucan binding protein [Fimicolochytrium jonesii]
MGLLRLSRARHGSCPGFAASRAQHLHYHRRLFRAYVGFGAYIHYDFQTLNQNVWKHDITLSGGGNWEFEWYTNNRTNSFVKNGTLFLKPTLTADNIGAENVVSGTTMDLNGNEAGYHCTDAGFFGCRRTSDGTNIINPVQSARISTAESVAIQYGRVEVKAKLPKGDWIWPAIWLLPKRPTYGNWPASGEIDIMESRGNKPGNAKSPGYDTIGSTLHWGPSYQFNKFDLTHKEFKLPSGSFGDEFHTFGLEWTPDYLRTYVDEPTNVVLEVPLSKSFWDKGGFPTSINNPWEDQCTAAPFDQEFYLILNVAVGGTASYFPDDAGDNKPWKNTAATAAKDFWDAKDQWYKTWEKDDVAMKVDSVKMWKMC